MRFISDEELESALIIRRQIWKMLEARRNGQVRGRFRFSFKLVHKGKPTVEMTAVASWGPNKKYPDETSFFITLPGTYDLDHAYWWQGLWKLPYGRARKNYATRETVLYVTIDNVLADQLAEGGFDVSRR
jgi:hypothetical protein